MITVKRILKAINEPKLSLYKGDGYWYFVFDDLDATGRYDSETVYVMRLNDMPISRWAENARDLIERVNKK